MKNEETSFGFTSLELNSTASSADSLSTSYSSCSSLDASDLNDCDFGNSIPERVAIKNLNEYKNNKFYSIRAKVIFKSEIKKWEKCFSRGKYFHLELQDETASIKAVAFKEACDEFYPALELNKVYNISGCKIKRSNKEYSRLPHDYELVFEKRGVVLSQYNESPSRDSCKASKSKVEYSEPLTVYSSIREVEQNAKGGRAYEVFHVDAIILAFIMRDIEQVVYRACPSDYCKKKVVPTSTKNEDDIVYYCSKCEKEFPSFEYRYMLKVEISDYSGSLLITMFQSAEQLLGIQALDLVKIYEKSPEQFRDYFRKCLLKRFCFTVEARKELYENIEKTNAICAYFYKTNFRDASRSLIHKLSEMHGEMTKK